MRDLYFCTKCWRNHDLYSKIGGDHAKHAFTLGPELEEAMDRACMKYQAYAPDLIVRYVKQGLRRDGVLLEERGESRDGIVRADPKVG